MFYNPFIIAPVASWAVAHTIKLLIALRQGEFSWRYLVSSGGFPSGHTSLVVAIVATSILELGWEDPLTGVALVLAAIVIYDAQGVRRAAEVLAAQVSQLSRDTKVKLDLPMTTARGHTIAEIIGGAVNGLIIAIVVSVILN